MHIKGSLIYNHMIKQKKLTHKYPLIQEGDKIKFVELRQPNPLGCNVISFMGQFPTELDIGKYIDYDTQYEKSFIEPLSFITKILVGRLIGHLVHKLHLRIFSVEYRII